MLVVFDSGLRFYSPSSHPIYFAVLFSSASSSHCCSLTICESITHRLSSLVTTKCGYRNPSSVWMQGSSDTPPFHPQARGNDLRHSIVAFYTSAVCPKIYLDDVCSCLGDTVACMTPNFHLGLAGTSWSSCAGGQAVDPDMVILDIVVTRYVETAGGHACLRDVTSYTLT